MNRLTLTGKDFTIGVLSVTAVMLFTCMVILHSIVPNQAFSSGQGGVTGDFIVSSARLDNMSEAIFILDSPAQQMNMYTYIPLRGTVELMQQFDLRALEVKPKDPAGTVPEENRGRNNRRNR